VIELQTFSPGCCPAPRVEARPRPGPPAGAGATLGEVLLRFTRSLARRQLSLDPDRKDAMTERSFNDLIREERPAHARRQAACRERLFGPDPEQEPPTKPPGDADGGTGEDPEAGRVFEQTECGRMEVFDLDDPMTNNPEGEHR
jgi:hypothetical protein